MATVKTIPKKTKEKRSIFFPIFVIIGAIILGIFLLIIFASFQPTGGGIAGYKCEFVGDKVTVYQDSIQFPKSGSCHFIERNAARSFYDWQKAFGENLEQHGEIDMKTQLVLDRSCRSYIIDVLPYVTPYLNNSGDNSFGIFRDANNQIFACIGMVGI